MESSKSTSISGDNGIFKVEKKYLKYKIINLLLFAGYSTVLPFQSVVVSSWGITSNRPALGAIGAPLLSSIADKTQKHKLVLLLCMILSSLIRFANYWVAHTFIQLIILCIFLDVSASPVENLLNNSILSGLDDRDDYGKQRLWGAIGWGLSALVFGWITSYLHSYSFLFYAFIFFEFAAIAVVAWKLEVVPPKSKDPTSFKDGLKLLFTSLDLFVLFFVFAALGAGNAVHQNFFFLFLQELGASEALMGSTLTATCFAELPFFFFSSIIIKKLTAKGVIAMTLFMYAARLVFYGLFLNNPYMAYGTEVFHGITFACFYSAGVTYSASVSPKGLEATTQGMMSAMYGGVGPLVGGLLGGYTYDALGSRPTFLYTGLGLFVCFAIFGLAELYQRFIKRSSASSGSSDHTDIKFSKVKELDDAAGSYSIEMSENQIGEQVDDKGAEEVFKIKRAGSGVI